MSSAVKHHFSMPVFSGEGSFTRKLARLHDQILLTVPTIDRIACAIYEHNDDLLKTFINSTRAGEAISNYEYRLSDSVSLSALVENREYRVFDEMAETVQPGTVHSDWLLKQGYRSSLTVPMYDGDQFLGFIFFDSVHANAFTPLVQRDLILFCNLINMAIASEFALVRTTLASANMARDLANLRDFETGAHLERMARYARIIAKTVAPRFGLDDEFIEHIFLFAPLHDIGKIGIPDSILLKPGKLDELEKKIMHTHVVKGVSIVSKIIRDFDLQKMPDSAVLANIVYCHHEWLDGSGYPRGLSGAAIPLEARIVTVADILDALTSKRPYKKAWTMEQACVELRRMADEGKLDEACVAAVEQSLPEIVEVARRFQDEAVPGM